MNNKHTHTYLTMNTAYFTCIVLAFTGSRVFSDDREQSLRNVISTDEHLTGFAVCLMLRNMEATDQQLTQSLSFSLNERMSDRIPAVISHLRSVTEHHSNCIPEAPSILRSTANVIRNERVNFARSSYQAYRRDNYILNRIVAIDEFWIERGTQQMIAAYAQDQIIAFKYLPIQRTLNSSLMIEFINDHLSIGLESIGISEPIILMDNLRAHFTSAVVSEFSSRGWTLWSQPRGSQDMMPLDIDVFPCLKVYLKRRCYYNNAEMRNAVTSAILDMNARRCMRSLRRLPDIWLEVIANSGDKLDQTTNKQESTPNPCNKRKKRDLNLSADCITVLYPMR